jgi:hypothetical protein
VKVEIITTTTVAADLAIDSARSSQTGKRTMRLLTPSSTWRCGTTGQS